jgi:hypothetical protein
MEPVVGLVVRGALVVRLGAGLVLVRAGLGVGFGVGRTVGVGLLVVATGLGDSVDGVTAAEGDSDDCSSACDAEAGAATPAAGFLSSDPPMALRPPPQQQSRTTPRMPAPNF